MHPRFGIRTKLLLSILAILLTSYSTLIYSTMKTLSATIRAEIDRNLETNLKFARSQYLDRALIAKHTLMNPVTAPNVQEDLKHGRYAVFSERVARWHTLLPFMDVVLLLDGHKRVVAGAAMEGGASVPYVVDQAITSRKPVVSTEIVSDSFLCNSGASDFCRGKRGKGEELAVLVALPVVAADGEVVGCVLTAEVLDGNDNLPAQVKGSEVDCFITQRDLRVASSLNEEKAGTLSPQVLDVLERGEQFRGELKVGGRMYETAIDPLMNSRGDFVGSIAVAVSTERFKAMRRENLANIFASASLGILCCFAIAFLASRKLTGHLRQLARGVKRIEEGDLDQRVEEHYGDEVGILASSFNRMAEALKERDRIIRLKTSDLEELNGQLEKKVAERTSALTMEMGRLEAVLTGMAEGVVVTDKVNRVILFNPAAQQLFELVPYRVLGQGIEQVCAMGGLGALAAVIAEVAATVGGERRKEELEVKGKRLHVFISSLADEMGKFAGLVMSIRDVTVEQEVDRMKTDFISTVSHELKTPLTSMKGSLQLLLNRGKWLTETERQLLSVCFRNTQRLIRLISEILDISGIESGGMAFNFRPVSIAEVAVYAIEEIKSLAMGRGISIVNSVGEHLPKVYGDSDRLIQVVTNLLSNAVKFSPEGKVVMVSAQQEGNYVTVSVADRGQAIEWADRDKLFKKFQQIESAERGKSGGTGLGLAICKEIVERHHGRIYYTAPKEQGNVFSFTVPIIGEGHGKGQDSDSGRRAGHSPDPQATA
ncbi:ATP-binding protein [Geomonas sp. RF6]|uniref:ATP-binding protein n=1 Tax=Geomonas sp. RF6 TaxID=2897342 RepID=UPI001E35CE31|nr:ATP-binding protein [Geomonas sp. RF6]UFS72194.1 ATP-binding protein [Geomonas sp. RF6]